MKALRIVIPVSVTCLTTVVIVLVTIWLTRLVPAGEWSGFLRALIIVAIVGATALIIAWSAYFSYVIREAIERSLSKE
ncbi:MAG: hypothetical protein V1932_05705 [Chloroflexota bacterium]